ncbi:flagellar motor switch protein FliM [Alteromonas macleodii]|uniref:flagellar motor switch protein FliM n=1 Tax=Alteromonas macleodii TaxID=28108 RepID=UPI003140447A|tara:strand:+ start:136133 stop:137131 length:999 start_codon:yes stop_codon:yes gene_type:complete
MSDFLDQSEIDKILNGGEGDEEFVDQSLSAGEPQKFDLGAQQKIIRGKIPALDIVNDMFARNYQRWMSGFLNSSVSVSPSDVKTMKMQEYLSELLQPTSLNIVKLNPFEGGSITVVVEAPLVYSSLNVYYGGESDYHYKIEGKDFHPIEKDYISNLLMGVFSEYKNAWRPLERVDMELLYSDTNPRYETSISPNETVYVSKMEVSFDGGGGFIHFCIPFPVLGPHLDDLDEKVKTFQGGVGVSWKEILAGEMVEAKVGVDLKVAQTKMLFKDINSAEVGDIIPLTMFDKAVLMANGHPVFVGDYCKSKNGNKAVKITGGLKHPGTKGEKKNV